MINQIKLKLRACKNLVFKNDSFIYETGWINSIKHLAPMDRNSAPIPWMNYPFVSFITARLSKDHNVFEYGSGYSTLYWAKYVKKVTAVEYDKSWFDKIKKEVADNVKLVYNDGIDDGLYNKACLNEGFKFDIIIVDGRNRVSCAECALEGLSEAGVIVLDDSHVSKYGDAFVKLKRKGFKEITFTGTKPVSVQFASTTIFYRDNNCLGI